MYIKDDLKQLAWYVKFLQYASCDAEFQRGCFVMTNTSLASLKVAIERIKSEGPLMFEGPGKKEYDIREVASKITVFSYQIDYNQAEDKHGRPLVEKFQLSEVFN